MVRLLAPLVGAVFLAQFAVAVPVPQTAQGVPPDAPYYEPERPPVPVKEPPRYEEPPTYEQPPPPEKPEWEVPEVPEWEEPEVPEVPEWEEPEVPEVPEWEEPEVPEVPEEWEPEVPEVPEWEEPEVPEVPEEWEPEVPEWEEPPKYTTEHAPEPTPYYPQEPPKHEEPKPTTTERKPEHTPTYQPEPPKPTYGSGQKEWKEYDDCVATCLAQYPPLDGKWTKPAPTPTEPSADAGAPAKTGGVAGTGATHTVIVAPSAGVFRYVPMAVNASIGDTIEFEWRGGVHTVTKSSELQVCNASTNAAEFFTSGRQDPGFVYREVVNNTNPVYYYCGVGTHCEQGMFGVINPPYAAGASTSVKLMMPQWLEVSPEVRALYNYTQSRVVGTPAEYWGDNLDVATIPAEAHAQFATNVLYTRLFLSANPASFEGGNFVPGAEMTIPPDVTQLSANPDGAPAAPPAPEAPANPGAGAPPAQESQPAGPNDNAAGASVVMSSSAVVVAVGAVLATLFAF